MGDGAGCLTLVVSVTVFPTPFVAPETVSVIPVTVPPSVLPRPLTWVYCQYIIPRRLYDGRVSANELCDVWKSLPALPACKSFEISISLAQQDSDVGAENVRLTVSVTPPTALPAVLAVPDAASAGMSVLVF